MCTFPLFCTFFFVPLPFYLLALDFVFFLTSKDSFSSNRRRRRRRRVFVIVVASFIVVIVGAFVVLRRVDSSTHTSIHTTHCGSKTTPPHEREGERVLYTNKHSLLSGKPAHNEEKKMRVRLSVGSVSRSPLNSFSLSIVVVIEGPMSRRKSSRHRERERVNVVCGGVFVFD